MSAIRLKTAFFLVPVMRQAALRGKLEKRIQDADAILGEKWVMLAFIFL